MAQADCFLPISIYATHMVKGKDGNVYTHCVVDEKDIATLKTAKLLTWDTGQDLRNAPDALKKDGVIAHEFFGNPPVPRNPTGIAGDVKP